MQYPDHLKKVIELLRKFPGVGTKSAERLAFHLLDWTPHEIEQFARTIGEIPVKIGHCNDCGALKESDQPCRYCNENRGGGQLCVVASSKDLLAIEETGQFNGVYHVVAGTISPLEGRGPEAVRFERLDRRIESLKIKEVIIALDATLEGDATALWLKRALEGRGVKVTRLAFGVPMGSSLDYVDGGTLAQALCGRTNF
jgi:recombination protein RecR